MLIWIGIAALILAGLALIIVEVIFIPGTTVVGVLGLIFLIAGVVFSYSEFGSAIGSYVLTATVLTTAGTLYLSFRKGAWKRFSLKGSIDSKVDKGVTEDLKAGLEGIAISALRPMGTAEFLGKIVEVKTNGDYLAPGTHVKILQIQANDILVEPLN